MKKICIALILTLASLSLLLALGGCKLSFVRDSIKKIDGYYVYKHKDDNNHPDEYALFGADSDKIINGVLTVPEQINGIPVTSLGFREHGWGIIEGEHLPMYENNEIKKIVVNHKLTIYGGAFSKLNELTEIEFSEYVLFLNYAVSRESIRSVSLIMDDSLDEILHMNDLHCARLKMNKERKDNQPYLKIYHPENVVALFIADYTRLPVSSFKNYKSLSSLIIPETVTEINKDAFKDCNVDVFVRLDEETFKQTLNNGWDEGVNVEWGFKDEIIVFDSMGGTEIQTESTQKNYVKAKIGETIAAPQQPTKEGYTFLGWFTDYTLVEQWNFAADVVQESTVLVAGWQKI